MTSVKYFHSAMNGAPVLSGTAGTLIGVLDACLVTGFGLQAATSVAVASGIATATFPSGHSFEPDTIALISGATPAGLNGEKRVLTTSTNTITFAAAGIADGAATGTITAKVAPVGQWAKEFSGTNLAAYRSADVTGTRMFLRVDDTSTTNARVVGYESMTDVNSGVGAFPLPTQISGGGWWPKASATDATARAWTLVADSKGGIFHLHTATSAPGASGCVWVFGDMQALKSGDVYAWALQCASGDRATYTSTIAEAAEYCTSGWAQLGVYLPRSYTSLGGSVAAAHAPSESCSEHISGGGSNLTAPIYPNGPDNGLILARKIYVEVGVCRRGYSRGMYVVPQNCHAQFNWRDKIDGQGELAGRKLLAIKCGSPAGTTSQGVLFVDITGPWSR